MNKSFFYFGLFLSVFVLSGCDINNRNEKLAPPTSTTSLPSANLIENSRTIASQDDAPVGKDSFLKSFVSGIKNWNLTGVKVSYLKTINSGARAIEKVSWTANCEAADKLRLEGIYPVVNFAMGTIDCGLNHKALELEQLNSILSGLTYSVSSSWNGKTRLYLSDIHQTGNINKELLNLGSSNSISQEDRVYLAFEGLEKYEYHFNDSATDVRHILDIGLGKGEFAGGDQIRLTYFWSNSRGIETKIEIEANLVTSN